MQLIFIFEYQLFSSQSMVNIDMQCKVLMPECWRVCVCVCVLYVLRGNKTNLYPIPNAILLWPGRNKCLL